MKNSLGNSLVLTIFGESHGEIIGAVLDGLCPGLKVAEEFIRLQLTKRRPNNFFETSRIEKDEFKIVSGVFNGYTTGAPLTILIPNENKKSDDYEKMYGLARPSHADYTSFLKYHGFEDYRGGGHFSGRITTSIVAAGSICLKALEKFNIKIASHILKCHDIVDRNFTNNIASEIDKINKSDFPVIDDIKSKLLKVFEEAKSNCDSVGGIIQTAILNLPGGLGEPWFDSVEGLLSRALFSIGAIKGVEFGAGFEFAKMNGSVANDEFQVFKDKIITLTNHNGGINGGITNGMPIIFNTVVKPTPSIAQKQNTINFLNNTNASIEIKGRHDPAIIRRICVVIDSIVAIVVYDILSSRYGTDIFLKHNIPM